MSICSVTGHNYDVNMFFFKTVTHVIFYYRQSSQIHLHSKHCYAAINFRNDPQIIIIKL